MLTNNISKAIFMGNGIATEFPFKFKVWDASQLIVTVVDPDEIERPAVGWSVALSESGGTITYLHEGAPLPTDYKLVILRNMPFTQGVDLITGTRFDPQVIEDALDRATAERQQLQEAAERSLKISPTAEFSADELLAQIFTAQVESANSAHMASESALSAQENSEQSSLNAQSAAESATQAQQSASEAAQDVSEAVALVEAEGTKQITLIQQEGEEQRANITQTINPDPGQANADKVPSEVAVSQALAEFDVPSVGYRVIYGRGRKATYAPNNINAIEDNALGSSGTVSPNSQYTLANPFGNTTQVVCKAEILINNVWCTSGWYNDNAGSRYGVTAASKDNHGIIVSVLQTGAHIARTISGSSSSTLSPNTLASAMCRVHVWKIGD